jgi:hypothetical protein
MSAQDEQVGLANPLLKNALVLLGSFVAATTALVHLLGGTSAFLGGLAIAGGVQWLNLAALGWLLGRLARSDARSAWLYTVLFMMKMGVLLGAVVVLLTFLELDMLGFVMGASLLLPALLFAGVWHALQPSANESVLRGNG